MTVWYYKRHSSFTLKSCKVCGLKVLFWCAIGAAMETVAGMAGACSVPDTRQAAAILMRDADAAVGAASDASIAWYALIVHQYKREQCEQMLDVMGYDYFSPCFQIVKIWSDRRKHIDVPLFPGYIFCRFNPEKRLALLRTPGILGIVSSGARFLEVDKTEIEALQTAMASKLPVEPYPSLVPGQKVRVMNGPLRGVNGVLVRTKAESRLVLSVAILNRAVSVEVQTSHLVAQNQASDSLEIL
jgi:transcription termination/antitermination protein NusG